MRTRVEFVLSRVCLTETLQKPISVKRCVSSHRLRAPAPFFLSLFQLIKNFVDESVQSLSFFSFLVLLLLRTYPLRDHADNRKYRYRDREYLPASQEKSS